MITQPVNLLLETVGAWSWSSFAIGYLVATGHLLVVAGIWLLLCGNKEAAVND